MYCIAIDGPAGAGKSTVAKEIAKRLGLIYLDTGAMYRAVALNAILHGIDTTDKDAVCSLLPSTEIDIKYIENTMHIFIGKDDVTGDIRTQEVSTGASNVAVFPDVRLKLVDIQRDIATRSAVVMDGRDIGTFVLPNADLKIFLNASAKERAKRRWLEFKSKGIEKDIDDIENEISYRDNNDSNRDFAPLKKADDAIEIDTTDMDIEDVINKIIELSKV